MLRVDRRLVNNPSLTPLCLYGANLQHLMGGAVGSSSSRTLGGQGGQAEGTESKELNLSRGLQL